MRANPGGSIDPQHIVGRDQLIDTIWRALEGQSVRLCSERRIGKTCILDKMVAECPPGWVAKKRDLSGVATPEEFVRAVFSDVSEHLGRWTKAAVKARAFLSDLRGAEVSGTRIPDVPPDQWKPLLERVVADLAEQQASEERLVFLWDEFPWMMGNIEKRSGSATANELLATLRALRQTYAGLRMVFTGSIGLHHVLTSLRSTGYANPPVNDMRLVPVPPLDLQDAKDLALRLLRGEGIATDDPEAVAETIARLVDCVPYYVHHIATDLVQAGTVTAETVACVVDEYLHAARDPWEFRHFDTRISTYYGDGQELARAILDAVAAGDGPISRAALMDELKSRLDPEPQALSDMVALLEDDGYIVRTTDGYGFAFMLIKRWWRAHRGLGQ